MRGALPGFVISWALGIYCVDRIGSAADPRSIQLACVVLALVGLAVGGAVVDRTRRLSVYCVAAALGGHGLAGQRVDAVWTPSEVRIEAVVEATVARVASAGPALRLDLEELVGTESRFRLPPRAQMFVRLPAAAFSELVPGDRVRSLVRLRRLVGRSNPGSADPAERLERAGVGSRAAPVHTDLLVRIDDGRWWTSVRRAFHQRRRAAALRLRNAHAVLAAALALGDRSGLTDADREALRALGLSHLLAVSGLHVALVGGLGFAWVRRVLLRFGRSRGRLDPRRTAWLAAWTGALLYGLLAGWGVPVRRAWVFGVALGAGFALRRSVSPWAPLALAGWAVLAAQPEALFDPGAQLSFAAATALQFARHPAKGPGGKLRGLVEGMSVSAVALAATAPLAAWHFGRTAPIALVTNLIAVPVTAAVLLPASLLAAVAAFLPPGLAGGSWLLDATGIGSSAVLAALTELAALLPAEASRSRASALGVLIAGACAVLVVRAKGVPSRLFWVFVGSVALAAVPPAPFAPARPRAIVLDVGQGDATLVQGREAAILVDTGGPGRGRNVILPALRAARVRRLDLVVLTHSDLDHRGGFLEVLRGVSITRLWVPRGAGLDPAFESDLTAARAAGVRVEERGAGAASLAIGDLVAVPVWPPPCEQARDRSGCRGLGRNDRSLVVRVDAPSSRILFPGDIEAAGERALLESGADLRADVLRVPHHGSRSSSSPAFLEAVAAEIAVASAPCLGRFEMPAPEIIERLAEWGADLHWTGPSGALVVALGGNREVRAWRSTPLVFCR